jgi:hypothetical protein
MKKRPARGADLWLAYGSEHLLLPFYSFAKSRQPSFAATPAKSLLKPVMDD